MTSQKRKTTRSATTLLARAGNGWSAPLLVAALLLAPAGALAKEKIDWDKRLEKPYHELAIGNFDKAAAMFAKEVSKHPESGAARTAQGKAFKQLGKMGEAKAAFRRATEVEPDFAESYYELGCMCESDKEWSEANKSFERYLQLAPLSSKKKSVEDRILNCRQNM